MKLTVTRERLAEVFKALGDETRLRILAILSRSGCCSCVSVSADEPGMCVCDVVEAIGLAQPTISHHLAVLERAGLIEGKKIGRWMYYRRNEPFLAELCEEFKKAV
ncbi:metalloregulator ArsR/SmtB family transcription factor [Candidatus Acetothermia bacterium]|nr:metalloregulator ArsR/SmtB family transcription factor [Candidatus Acetothermia bacterium]MCI2431131.1 metalloregulator ArsR/SmtB family transcription factor [Candidatus Acetothermia bacterium]MCI2436021.1 metalloregulator ArsR/SmtB family transcription factor [Candidatus Acetothermia bacterium]